METRRLKKMFHFMLLLIKNFMMEKVEQSGFGSVIFFLPENLDDLCESSKLIIQGKQTRNDSNRLEDRIFVLFDTLLGDHALPPPNKNIFELNLNYYKSLSYFKKNDI